MSFGNTTKTFGVVQEALVLALMLVSMYAVFYIEMSIAFKIGIMVIAFSVILLMTLATQILRQQKEARKAAAA